MSDTTVSPDADLLAEQKATLGAARRRYGLLARILFNTMDLVYGTRAPAEGDRQVE